MKHAKQTLTLAVFAASGIIAWSQTPPTDWSWTFQRWGVTCGLLFEDTGLSNSAKAAIRDDICQVYEGFTLPTHLFSEIYDAEHPKYGTFVGFDGLRENNGCPSGLGGWDYKLHNGHRYFNIDKKLSSTYLEKIALTNRFQAAAASLSNFIAAVNSTTTNNAVMSEYLQHWWIMANNRTLDAKDLPNPGDFMKLVASFSDEEMFAPSILSFMMGTDELVGALCYDVLYKKRSDGRCNRSLFDLVFKNGQWRIAMPFYDADL